MAASATNTSREIGAVGGVVVLGALVDAELKSGLVTRMTQLHLPASLQALVVQVVETGGGAGLALGGGGRGGGGGGGGSGGGLIGQLLRAGYSAFETALHIALFLSAGLLAAAALLAFVTLRGRAYDG